MQYNREADDSVHEWQTRPEESLLRVILCRSPTLQERPLRRGKLSSGLGLKSAIGGPCPLFEAFSTCVRSLFYLTPRLFGSPTC
jgi:hypothetical protein